MLLTALPLAAHAAGDKRGESMAKDNRKFQQNRAKKIAKAKVKAAKRKKAEARSPFPVFESRYGVTRAELRAAPFYAVYYTPILFEDGMGQVIISRELDDGVIASAFFLLDAFCLGVKNTFLRVMTSDQFEEMLEETRVRMELKKVSPEFAGKLVHDTIAFARSLGFEPHPEFEDASILLEGIAFSSCEETFTFGKNGKPLYMNGPNSTEAEDRAIIKKLAAKLGPDGFNYTVNLGQLTDDA